MVHADFCHFSSLSLFLESRALSETMIQCHTSRLMIFGNNPNKSNSIHDEIRSIFKSECLLSFSTGSSVFQSAVQKCKRSRYTGL